MASFRNAVLVIGFFAVIIWVVIGDLWSPEGKLVRRFDQLAFDADLNSSVAGKIIWKWNGPVTIRVHGGGALEESLVRGFTYVLRRLSGLDMNVTSPGKWGENINVYFAEKSQWPEIIRRHYGTLSRDEHANYTCVAFPDGYGGTLLRGYILIPSTLPSDDLLGCVVHEMTHLLGLIGHSRSPSPSVLSKSLGNVDFALRDKILIRALYDRRIRPGMDREKALVVVRKIFTKLLAAHEKHGMGGWVYPDDKKWAPGEKRKTVMPFLDSLEEKERKELLKKLK